jgi:hypothetical protein
MTVSSRFAACLLGGVFSNLVITWSVNATVVTLGSAKDNTLYQDAAGALSNGAGEFFFAGNTGTGSIRRGLITFDLSSIPSNAIINSVSLTLHMSMTSAPATDVALHSVLTNWGEGTSDASGGEGAGIASTSGDATWIHTFYNTSFWTNPGGDFAAASSATLSVNAVGFYTWNSLQMATDVQQWISNPSTNFGWLLQGNESTFNTSKRFDTRENATPEFRPMLMVDYMTVPGPPALTFLMIGAIKLGGRRRG